MLFFPSSYSGWKGPVKAGWLYTCTALSEYAILASSLCWESTL